MKGHDESSGELKLELNDTNRPDLWCVEGIARQIRPYLDRKAAAYPFYARKTGTASVINAAPSIRTIRPFIGACIARGLSIDDETLVQLIQTQEKLGESFGRRRQLVSIGLYRLAGIAFPVEYKTVPPESVRFVPLGSESPMTPAEILKRHPKGIAYAGILSKAAEYPILIDREGRVLSFPPIINGREIGEVRAGDRDLFVEVTGTDLRMVMLTVNILAANLADRGAAIAPVEVRYPYPTDFGKTVRMPAVLSKPMAVSLDRLGSALGEAVAMAEAVSVLKRYGYAAHGRGKTVSASVPPYRDDLMHPVDVVEDFAIGRGYDSFRPEMPSEFTVGGLSPLEQFSDRVREWMIGMGFQEVISNILTNREELLLRMNLTSEEELVSVENVMSQTYSAVRNWIIPSLLKVEAASSKAFYPHRVFETGETAVVDPGHPEGTRTHLKLAGLIAHPSAHFSEIHSHLEALMYYAGESCRLEPIPHPSFIEGRAGRIVVAGKEVGLIGELHPRVLENWQITMPCAVFELRLDGLEQRRAEAS
jgi:phenylalanyl-tRNA synthetase beta chain